MTFTKAASYSVLRSLHVSTGYSYLEDWMVHSADDKDAPVPLREVLAGKGADGGSFGWLYNVDFGTYTANPGQPKKGLAHFVRRRRLTREAVFNGMSVPFVFFRATASPITDLIIVPALLFSLFLCRELHW
jgi:hypothetical protein